MPPINDEHADRLSLCQSSTTAELSELRMALQRVRMSQRPLSTLILCDSQSALYQLSSRDRAGSLANEVAHLVRSIEDAGWKLSFQWIFADSSIPGSERADALAAASTRRRTLPNYTADSRCAAHHPC